VLLVFGAPGQLPSLAGQEHGRTIPLATALEGIASLYFDRKRHIPERPIPYGGCGAFLGASGMGGSNVVTFADPQAYEAAISPAQVEFLVTTAGKYRAALTEIELHRLWLQRGRESLPRVANATVRADRSSLYFLAGADQALTSHSGRVLAFGEIVASASGSTHHLRTEGPCHWATVSMTRDDLATAGKALVGRDLVEPSVTQYFRPPRPAMSRLLNLHRAAAELAGHTANILTQPEPARALEQSLLHTMIMCLSDSAPVQMHSAALRHATIIARFEEVLATNYDQPLYLAEICAATGASERVLRISCMEHLGMGPVRYLWLRRMHLVRRALILAAPAAATVTEIATGNGFFELGRFAVGYRGLFGEPPKVTLQRPAQVPLKSNKSPFAFAEAGYV
jgi:AraC-like DNA-binding protein